MIKRDKICLELREALPEFSVFCKDAEFSNVLLIKPKYENDGEVYHCKLPYDLLEDISPDYYGALFQQVVEEIVKYFKNEY